MQFVEKIKHEYLVKHTAIQPIRKELIEKFQMKIMQNEVDHELIKMP
jgi:hypothetical protein